MKLAARKYKNPREQPQADISRRISDLVQRSREFLLVWKKEGRALQLRTSRSSRIPVSTFERQSNVQSDGETRSTFARWSEKTAKYARGPVRRTRSVRLRRISSDARAIRKFHLPLSAEYPIAPKGHRLSWIMASKKVRRLCNGAY